MKENMENYRQYQTKGLTNKDQLTNQVALYYQQQNNLLGLSGQNEQNALQITALESQIHTQAAEFDNQIYQMELQRCELQKFRGQFSDRIGSLTEFLLQLLMISLHNERIADIALHPREDRKPDLQFISGIRESFPHRRKVSPDGLVVTSSWSIQCSHPAERGHDCCSISSTAHRSSNGRRYGDDGVKGLASRRTRWYLSTR
ncbi:hypothetical protein SME20J_35540 [Serratia marcescens]|nr:hypothetical protein SME20J_35540 [Serratia marcescens]